MSGRRNVKYIYYKIVKSIKNFLLSEKSREFLIFLFFFFIAGAFWLLQTLNDDYEVEFSIPVRLKGVPNSVVITSDPPSELRIRVKDKGTVLLNYMLAKSFFPITLNYGDYKSEGNHVRIYSSQFEKKILGQLNLSTKLLWVKPDTVDYIYTNGSYKLVPVRLKGKVTAGRQYYISDTIFRPDSVLVYAPPPILDTITAAYTQNFKLDNITDTVVKSVPLIARKGVKFIPGNAEIVFPVDFFTDKTVEVPISGVKFPSGKVLRTFPSKINITFQVGLSHFRSVHPEDFRINISYDELLNLKSDKFTVKLASAPKGIRHVRFSPSTVDFLIEQLYPASHGN